MDYLFLNSNSLSQTPGTVFMVLINFLAFLYFIQFYLIFFFLPGFAQEKQFQLNPQNENFGNQVTLVSDSLSVPCDVERDSTHGNQIQCYSR